ESRQRAELIPGELRLRIRERHAREATQSPRDAHPLPRNAPQHVVASGKPRDLRCRSVPAPDLRAIELGNPLQYDGRSRGHPRHSEVELEDLSISCHTTTLQTASDKKT